MKCGLAWALDDNDCFLDICVLFLSDGLSGLLDDTLCDFPFSFLLCLTRSGCGLAFRIVLLLA